MSVKERIDYNIEDLKNQIRIFSHHLKALIRESLGQKRLNDLKSQFAAKLRIGKNGLTHVDFQKLDDQILAIEG